MTSPATQIAQGSRNRRRWGRYILNCVWLLILGSIGWRNISEMDHSGFAWSPMLISAAACVGVGLYLATVLDGPRRRADEPPAGNDA